MERLTSMKVTTMKLWMAEIDDVQNLLNISITTVLKTIYIAVVTISRISKTLISGERPHVCSRGSLLAMVLTMKTVMVMMKTGDFLSKIYFKIYMTN